MELGKIRRAISNPSLVFRMMNRLYHKKLGKRPYNSEGINIFEEDWDNLIILDAARYELFEKFLDKEGYDDLTSKTSRGSNSFEFVLGNLFDQDLTDTVYLTSNGYIRRRRDELDNEMNIHSIEYFDRT